MPEETIPVYSGTQSEVTTSTTAGPEISYPARSDYMYTDLGVNGADTNGIVEQVAVDSDAQTEVKKRPMRWLQRGFTILGTACLCAPWIFIQGDSSPSRTLTGLEVLLGPIFSPLGADVGIASLALLASLVLPLLMFFRFKNAATQKWGERSTIALAPLASVLCLDMISFYYAGLTNTVGLRWGIWAACAFYSLAGFTSLINARRLGHVSRAELFGARAGWIFTWLFCFADILAILVTMIGLAMLGKFSLGGTAIPFIWLFLGALLSLIA
jgi:hypothetical protein